MHIDPDMPVIFLSCRYIACKKKEKSIKKVWEIRLYLRLRNMKSAQKERYIDIILWSAFFWFTLGR